MKETEEREENQRKVEQKVTKERKSGWLREIGVGHSCDRPERQDEISVQ